MYNTCQNQTDFERVIWVFGSQLRVAKGQIASYGAFLYKNKCLSESPQRRAFAVVEVFTDYNNLCANTKLVSSYIQCSHRWKHHLKKELSIFNRTDPEQSQNNSLCSLRQVLFFLLSFIVIERRGLDDLQVRHDWPHLFISFQFNFYFYFIYSVIS